MKLRVIATLTPINLVQVYVPTSSTEDGHKVILQRPRIHMSNREITIILGDFNSKIDQTEEDELIRTHIGRFGIGLKHSVAKSKYLLR